MFELHLGENLQVSSEKFKEGFFVAGNPGQGKTVFLVQLALELIKNGQKGLLIDPYGDLAKTVEDHIKTEQAKKGVEFISLDIEGYDLAAKLQDKFVIVSGKYFDDGHRMTAKKIQRFVTKYYKQAKDDQWLIIDEALSCVNDEIFELYLASASKNIHYVFSGIDFLQLSKKERAEFANVVQNYVIYKTRNMDAVLLSRERGELDPKKIKAIEQYHFQALIDGGMKYTKGLHPLGEI